MSHHLTDTVVEVEVMRSVALYLQVKEVLEVNKAERHIRGGLATREKYLHNKTK